MQVVGDEAKPAPTLVQLLEGDVGHQQAADHKERIHRGQSVHHSPKGKAKTAGLYEEHLPDVADGQVGGHHEEVVAEDDPRHADEPDPVDDVQVVRAGGLLRGHDGDKVGVEGEGEAEAEAKGRRLGSWRGVVVVHPEDASEDVDQGSEAEEDAEDGKCH